MNKDILSNLKNIIPQLTTSQRTAANYIIQNPTDSAFLTIEQLARTIGTSTSTIVRLALSLGYAGYSEFQKELQELLRNRVSPYERLSTNLRVLDDNNLISKNVETQINNITTTAEQLDEEILNQTIVEIMKAKKIYCLGMRSGFTAAHFLYHGLNRMLGKCELLGNSMGELAEKVANITSDDVVIAVTLPRYKGHVYHVLNVIQRRNAKIISITDSYASPVAEYSDILLPCNYRSNGFHNSLIGPIFVADTIISLIALKYPDQIRKRLQEIEPILDELNHEN